MKTLKERMQEALDESGKRQSELAAACGVSSPSVNDWLSGKTKSLKAGTAIRAAAFLNVSPVWLAEGRGPKRTADQPLPPTDPPEPSNVAPPPAALSVEALLDQLRERIATQPEAVRRAIGELVSQYVATPDEHSGRAVAEAIARLVGKPPEQR